MADVVIACSHIPYACHEPACGAYVSTGEVPGDPHYVCTGHLGDPDRWGQAGWFFMELDDAVALSVLES